VLGGVVYCGANMGNGEHLAYLPEPDAVMPERVMWVAQNSLLKVLPDFGRTNSPLVRSSLWMYYRGLEQLWVGSDSRQGFPVVGGRAGDLTFRMGVYGSWSDQVGVRAEIADGDALPVVCVWSDVGNREREARLMVRQGDDSYNFGLEGGENGLAEVFDLKLPVDLGEVRRIVSLNGNTMATLFVDRMILRMVDEGKNVPAIVQELQGLEKQIRLNTNGGIGAIEAKFWRQDFSYIKSGVCPVVRAWNKRGIHFATNEEVSYGKGIERAIRGVALPYEEQMRKYVRGLRAFVDGRGEHPGYDGFRGVEKWW